MKTASHSDTVKKVPEIEVNMCGGVKKFNNALENNCKTANKVLLLAAAVSISFFFSFLNAKARLCRF